MLGTLIKFILLFLVIYWLSKFVIRILLPAFRLGKMVKDSQRKFAEEMYQYQRQQQQEQKQKSSVQSEKDKDNDFEGGEYIDFEEVS